MYKYKKHLNSINTFKKNYKIFINNNKDVLKYYD